MPDAAPTVLDALLGPFLDPASRTWWPTLLCFVGVALAVAWKRGTLRNVVPGALAVLRHPSSRLDLQLLAGRQLVRLLLGSSGVGGAWVLATHLVRRLDGWLGVPAVPELPTPAIALLYSVVLFVAWDLSRFVAHLLMHRVPLLWHFHQVHHSAEVMSPLTFHRVHPVESVLYQARGALVTGLVTGVAFWLWRDDAVQLTLLGVPAAGLLLNAAFGNLRHSHVWLRFPAPVERWFLSPAQHQLHHSDAPEHRDVNLGTWLAVWDRLAGTLCIQDAPPARFGVHDRNHGDDLLSAWFGPLRAAVGARGIALGAVLLLALGSSLAQADEAGGGEDSGAEDAGEEEAGGEEAGEEEESGEDAPPPPWFEPGVPGMEMIVSDESGTPRVAGSAHEIGAEVLDRYEYDNIEKILSQVPGVTTRGEDGFGLRPNIGIRGANSDRSAKITLMEDGVLLAPAPYAAPAAYYFPMSARMVGVEVFKGPAATRFGPHTVGGAINLRTRDVPREGPAWLAEVSGGNHLTLRGHGFVGTGDATRGALLEAVHLHSNGFKEIDGVGGPTGFDRTELMGKARIAPAAAHDLELKLGFGHELSHETYLGLTGADLAATPDRRYAASALGRMRWNRTQAELAWLADAGALRVRTVAYHHYLSRAWTKLNGFGAGIDLHDLLQQDPDSGSAAVYLDILRGVEDSATADQVLLIGTNDRRFHSYGLQSTALWSVQGDRVGSELELGLRLHADDVHRVHTEDPHDMVGGVLVQTGEPVETILDSDTRARALAAHVHDDLRLGRLHLLPGLRLEVVHGSRADIGVDPHPTTTRATLLPGAGALWQATDWLSVLGGAHRGFSPVSPGQDAEVRPELSWNYEGGVRVHPAGLPRVEAIGFYNDYRNITGQCTLSGGCSGDQLDQQFNGGAAEVYGLESVAGVELVPPGAFTVPIEASYAWTKSRFLTGFVSGFPQFGAVEAGDALPYSPEHQAGGRIALVHPRFEVGAGASWRSAMLDEAGLFPAGEGDIPDLLLLDAAVTVNATDLVRFTATGTNLANDRSVVSWRPYGARPNAPLQVMVGVEVGPSER
ncbi:MAG: TonB-dependent receptor [Alphaproteobacteria bacterium]|nr:TonB-dependent receptor [Alphaproteobacteria bacterium]